MKTKLSIDDLFGGGVTGNMLNGYFDGDPRVYHWFQTRHKKHNHFINRRGIYNHRGHEWPVPYGIRLALAQRLSNAQMVVRYPWYVTWQSPRTGRRLKKYFESLPAAIHFIATKAQYVDPRACVVSRQGYHIPAKLRGRLPRPWKWCPCCMTARKFYRAYSGETFYAQVKEWSEEKQRYIFKERRVALLRCKVCGITNRNHKYRRSNQPWEVRRFKPGARRARRRR